MQKKIQQKTNQQTRKTLTKNKEKNEGSRRREPWLIFICWSLLWALYSLKNLWKKGENMEKRICRQNKKWRNRRTIKWEWEGEVIFFGKNKGNNAQKLSFPKINKQRGLFFNFQEYLMSFNQISQILLTITVICIHDSNNYQIVKVTFTFGFVEKRPFLDSFTPFLFCLSSKNITFIHLFFSFYFIWIIL